MSEYSDKHSKEIQEEVAERCFEARCAADWWASKHPNATPKEVIAEGEKRYNSFYETRHFILEAAEVIEIIKRKHENNDKK